ncbi:hypothetical protein [Deinococcus sp. UYEF24]
MVITETDVLRRALAEQYVFAQGELKIQPSGGPLLCPAPLPDLDPALLVGTIETLNAEGQYSAWIMFGGPPDQRLPGEAALVALGWHSQSRHEGAVSSTFMGGTPEALHSDPEPLPPGLYLHPETRTVLFVRPGPPDQDQQVIWELDTGRSYAYLSRAPRELLILAALRHPAGASVVPVNGTRGESDTLTHSAESVLITWPGTAADLHAQYAAQLTAAGWADRTPEPSGSSSAWSFDSGAGLGLSPCNRFRTTGSWCSSRPSGLAWHGSRATSGSAPTRCTARVSEGGHLTSWDAFSQAVRRELDAFWTYLDLLK